MLQHPPLNKSPLFMAVQMRRNDLVRLLLHMGASPNERIEPQSILILSFAVFDTARDSKDTADIVLALLAGGADIHCIPQYMWKPYDTAPSVDPKRALQGSENLVDAAKWCRRQSGYEALLARQVHLTHPYFLCKTSELLARPKRILQMAEIKGISPLLEIPYHIIGQDYATTEVTKKIVNHVALNMNEPLVMIFTDLSGHGKTELARQMGTYLSAEHLLVDCTAMKRESDLFGPKEPYVGSKNGSPLNNHLCKTVGKRNIVLLDEFEKTMDEVREALLLVLQDGTSPQRPSILRIILIWSYRHI